MLCPVYYQGGPTISQGVLGTFQIAPGQPCTLQMLICHQTTNIYNSLVGHMGIPAIEHGFWTSKLTMSVESDDAKKSKCSKSSNSSKSATEINFLGRMISQKCLSTLVGIGKARLRKAMDAIPDARYGKTKSGHLRTAASVHAWLAIQYSQIAETLPDRPWGKLFCCGLWMFPLRKPCSIYVSFCEASAPALSVCLSACLYMHECVCVRMCSYSYSANSDTFSPMKKYKFPVRNDTQRVRLCTWMYDMYDMNDMPCRYMTHLRHAWFLWHLWHAWHLWHLWHVWHVWHAWHVNQVYSMFYIWVCHLKITSWTTFMTSMTCMNMYEIWHVHYGWHAWHVCTWHAWHVWHVAVWMHVWCV